jgi:hypothetical protein
LRCASVVSARAAPGASTTDDSPSAAPSAPAAVSTSWRETSSREALMVIVAWAAREGGGVRGALEEDSWIPCRVGTQPPPAPPAQVSNAIKSVHQRSITRSSASVANLLGPGGTCDPAGEVRPCTCTRPTTQPRATRPTLLGALRGVETMKAWLAPHIRAAHARNAVFIMARWTGRWPAGLKWSEKRGEAVAFGVRATTTPANPIGAVREVWHRRGRPGCGRLRLS